MIKKDLQEMRIAVLMGGTSSEREISLKTGVAIENALRDQGLQVIGIDADNQIPERLLYEKVDIIFLALHGKYGEDGAIQGLLEMLHIPYTGSKVLASALAFDKVKAKHMFCFHHIPTPRFVALEHKNFPAQRGKIKDLVWAYPVVVKPSEEGSTIGITLVRGSSALEDACVKAFEYGKEILIEQFIEGREITVGILGDEALPVIEVVPVSGFYDYESKYTKGKTEYIVPAKLEKRLWLKVQSLALKAHKALGCRGVSRVDFRVNQEGNPFVLEVNTIPGMTELSLLPKAAQVAGISFQDLVKRILVSAIEDET